MFYILQNIDENFLVSKPCSIFGMNYRPDIPLLLGLYEAVHLNRNFVLALTTSHASSRIGSSHSLNDLPEEVPPAIPRASDGMFCTCHR